MWNSLVTVSATELHASDVTCATSFFPLEIAVLNLFSCLFFCMLSSIRFADFTATFLHLRTFWLPFWPHISAFCVTLWGFEGGRRLRGSVSQLSLFSPHPQWSLGTALFPPAATAASKCWHRDRAISPRVSPPFAAIQPVNVWIFCAIYLSYLHLFVAPCVVIAVAPDGTITHTQAQARLHLSSLIFFMEQFAPRSWRAGIYVRRATCPGIESQGQRCLHARGSGFLAWV